MAREKGGGTGMNGRVREERGVGGKEKEGGRRGDGCRVREGRRG